MLQTDMIAIESRYALYTKLRIAKNSLLGPTYFGCSCIGQLDLPFRGVVLDDGIDGFPFRFHSVAITGCSTWTCGVRGLLPSRHPFPWNVEYLVSKHKLC